MSKSRLVRFAWIMGFLVGSILLAVVAGLALGLPLLGPVVYSLILGAAIFLLLWLAWRGLQLFLWRVGRRLAFSYFLIGILPIPMVVLLILLNLYLLAGYFLGHLYRTAAGALQHEVVEAAAIGLERFELTGRSPAAGEGELAVAYYIDERHAGGSDLLPELWPGWLTESAEQIDAQQSPVSFVALADGSPTLVGTARQGRRGVLAAYTGSLEAELARRSGVWVLLLRAEDASTEGMIHLDLMGKKMVLQPLAAKPRRQERNEFFGVMEGEESTVSWRDRPLIWWGVISGPLRSLYNGTPISEYITASLNGTPTTVFRQLLGGSAEVNTAIWASLIAISGVLLSIYALAIIMAFFMIFGLSRAVNQLSRATNAVRRGEFSVRIPVRRRDQIGELHHSFNEMAAGLDRSVLARAHQEMLEKELKIARELQESLLPAELPSSDRIDFATLFQPSAAIGGDYFDILRIDENRLVVVIADVSGHGLPTGLRMAMLKAALVILVEEQKPPDEIFRRLSAMVRSEQERRFFVTATLAVIDFTKGEMEITNAAHAPTYLIRRGAVSEIALIGHPLGALGDEYGRRTVLLTDGDVIVWLSDGLIEAVDDSGEPFGYQRLLEALAGPTPSAATVRDRLLAAEEKFTGGKPAVDDKTLVAMRYSVAAAGSSTPAAE